jgi:hypothetical protein
MRQFIIISLLLICNTIFSQNENKELIGKWVYLSFNTEGLSKKVQKSLNETNSLFENSSMIFNNDMTSEQSGNSGKTFKTDYKIENNKIIYLLENGQKQSFNFRFLNSNLYIKNGDLEQIYTKDKTFTPKLINKQNETSNENLFGKWIFSDFKKEDLSKQQINDLNEMKPMFQNSYIVYSNDYSYSQVNAKGKEVKGSFALDKDKINITLNNGIKSTDTYKMIGDELIIFDNDFAMIFKRDKSFIVNKIKIDEKKVSIKTTSIKESDLIGKWYITEFIKPNRSKEQLALLKSMVEGSNFVFKVKNNYDVEMMKIKEKGKWQLSEKGDELTLIKQDSSETLYKIISLENDELVLNLGISEEQLKLSKKK